MSYNEAKKIFLALKEFEYSITHAVTDMGNIAYKHTMDSFRNQGYTDSVFTPWKRRKNKDSKRGRISRAQKRWGTEAVRSVKNRGILIGKGSGTTGLRGSYRKVRRGLLSISIINDKIYSGVHNEGLKAGRGNGFTMPERRMIGDSAVMRRKIENKINFRIRKIWRS